MPNWQTMQMQITESIITFDVACGLPRNFNRKDEKKKKWLVKLLPLDAHAIQFNVYNKATISMKRNRKFTLHEKCWHNRSQVHGIFNLQGSSFFFFLQIRAHLITKYTQTLNTNIIFNTTKKYVTYYHLSRRKLCKWNATNEKKVCCAVRLIYEWNTCVCICGVNKRVHN